MWWKLVQRATRLNRVNRVNQSRALLNSARVLLQRRRVLRCSVVFYGVLSCSPCSARCVPLNQPGAAGFETGIRRRQTPQTELKRPQLIAAAVAVS